MIWCDLHDYDGKNDHHNDFIEGADFIFMSSEKMPTYKQYMKELINRGKELVVCTHGKDGASAINKKGEEINTGIIRSYEVKDTNGAGDSFFSGFLYGFHKGFDTENCMKFGTIVAGLCVSSEGKFSLTAGKRESIKIILPIFQYVSKARWATYLHLMSNYPPKNCFTKILA
jgi:sugar/nucleoside kinase (ribokinase family)